MSKSWDESLHYLGIGFKSPEQATVHDMQEDVLIFMFAGEQPIAEIRTAISYIPICEEEDREFSHACRVWCGADRDSELEKHAATQIIDACFDSIWTKIAMLNALGVNLEEVWIEGAQSNLAKIGPEGQFVKNDKGKIQKPEGWKVPNFKQFVKKLA